ncbi:MAG: redox-regulated ATPase YchF, partial [Deltaproteobacteria bacterium]
MKVAIFGQRFCGKTTVFSSLTGIEPPPGQAGKASIGTVKVPDGRLDRLASIYEPKKKTQAEFVLLDVPSPQTGLLDTQTLSVLRTADVLTLVVRAFSSPMHDGPPHPRKEYLDVEQGLMIEDMAVVEKRLERISKESAGRKTQEGALLERCLAHLDASRPLRTLELTEQEAKALKGYQLLSLKSLVVLVNTPEESPGLCPPELEQIARDHGASVMPLCARAEAEIMQLEPDERKEFLADLGVETCASERYLRHAYESLGLISFFTVGKDECRAWTIRRGTVARRAAGAIHSDIERGFIRAEVVS